MGKVHSAVCNYLQLKQSLKCTNGIYTPVLFYVVNNVSFLFQGFYAVYDEIFKTLAEEDKQFMEEEDFVVYDFGNSQSSFEEVSLVLFLYAI